MDVGSPRCVRIKAAIPQCNIKDFETDTVFQQSHTLSILELVTVNLQVDIPKIFRKIGHDGFHISDVKDLERVAPEEAVCLIVDLSTCASQLNTGENLVRRYLPVSMANLFVRRDREVVYLVSQLNWKIQESEEPQA